MTRAEHLTAAGATRDQIGDVLDDLANIVSPAETGFSWRPQLNDPDDEMVLEAAINGQASAIVTFETTTFQVAAARFGIEVMTPAPFLG